MDDCLGYSSRVTGSQRGPIGTTCFCTKRRSGRAPNAGSYAAVTIASSADSDASRWIPASRCASAATSCSEKAWCVDCQSEWSVSRNGREAVTACIKEGVA